MPNISELMEYVRLQMREHKSKHPKQDGLMTYDVVVWHEGMNYRIRISQLRPRGGIVRHDAKENQ